MAFDQKQAEKIVLSFPEKQRSAVADLLPRVSAALESEGILTPKVLAYALATINHETAGTFRPIEEYGGRSQAKKLGYSGGENYYGRGYIQLTHDYNYDKYGKRLGVDLKNNPELALDPVVSARILAAYMKDTGVAQAVEQGDTARARKLVQGFGQATNKTIPKVTKNYQDILKTIGNPDRPYRTEGGGAFPTQQYGDNPQYYSGTGLQGHEGFDFRADEGTPLYNTFEQAEVAYVGNLPNTYGNFVVLRSPQNEAMLLAHLSEVQVKPGDKISAGQQVGLTGSTGAVLNGKKQPHLHAGYSQNYDEVARNLDEFKKTGRWPTKTGGFEDPKELFTDSYTRRFFEPETGELKKEPSEGPSDASKSAFPQIKGISIPEQAKPANILKMLQESVRSPLDDAKKKLKEQESSLPKQDITRPMLPEMQKNKISVRLPESSQATASREVASASATNPFNAPRPSRAIAPTTGTYTVRRGDTPSGIAQSTLGDASRWREIWQGDPRKMPAGAVLKIPTPGGARR